jgi:DNA-binding NarL/FixJ family response regulator
MIADDSYLIREGLQQVLGFAPELEVVGAFADMPALLAAVDAAPPDVVVSDIRMPPTQTDEGIRIAERLRRTHPKLGVVVLSQHGSATYAAQLLDCGSAGRGYLLKDRIHDLDHLVSTIKAVAAGECRIDPRLVDELVASRRSRKRSPLAELTPRQREILADIAAGKSNLAIASERCLTQRAVEKHVSEIFGRLGLGSDESISRRVHATLLYLSQRDA